MLYGLIRSPFDRYIGIVFSSKYPQIMNLKVLGNRGGEDPSIGYRLIKVRQVLEPRLRYKY